MKARREFNSDGEFRDYLLQYYSGQALQGYVGARRLIGINPEGPVKLMVLYAETLLKELKIKGD